MILEIRNVWLAYAINWFYALLSYVLWKVCTPFIGKKRLIRAEGGEFLLLSLFHCLYPLILSSAKYTKPHFLLFFFFLLPWHIPDTSTDVHFFSLIKFGWLGLPVNQKRKKVTWVSRKCECGLISEQKKVVLLLDNSTVRHVFDCTCGVVRRRCDQWNGTLVGERDREQNLVT